VLEGTERQAYAENYELSPVDRQTNGPQLFYGLRYHTHIVKVARSRHSTIKWATGYGNRQPVS